MEVSSKSASGVLAVSLCKLAEDGGSVTAGGREEAAGVAGTRLIGETKGLEGTELIIVLLTEPNIEVGGG